MQSEQPWLLMETLALTGLQEFCYRQEKDPKQTLKIFVSKSKKGDQLYKKKTVSPLTKAETLLSWFFSSLFM